EILQADNDDIQLHNEANLSEVKQLLLDRSKRSPRISDHFEMRPTRNARLKTSVPTRDDVTIQNHDLNPYTHFLEWIAEREDFSTTVLMAQKAYQWIWSESSAQELSFTRFLDTLISLGHI